jgi:hypothetical protein
VKEQEGSVIRLSKNCAEITLGHPLSVLTNLKMNLEHVSEKLSVRDFYGKIIKRLAENESSSVIRFTSIPPEVDAYFQAHLEHPVERGGRQKPHPVFGRGSYPYE